MRNNRHLLLAVVPAALLPACLPIPAAESTTCPAPPPPVNVCDWSTTYGSDPWAADPQFTQGGPDLNGDGKTVVCFEMAPTPAP